MATRTWDNYVLEHRIEYGSAARRNRGRYSGAKVHRLSCQYVIGLVDPTLTPKPGTISAAFARTGKPVLFSCWPCCGCTQGQHAGTPTPGLSQADVTCTKCGTDRPSPKEME